MLYIRNLWCFLWTYLYENFIVLTHKGNMSIPIPVFTLPELKSLELMDVTPFRLVMCTNMDSGHEWVKVCSGLHHWTKRFAVAHYHVKYKYLIYLTLFLLDGNMKVCIRYCPQVRTAVGRERIAPRARRLWRYICCGRMTRLTRGNDACQLTWVSIALEWRVVAELPWSQQHGYLIFATVLGSKFLNFPSCLDFNN